MKRYAIVIVALLASAGSVAQAPQLDEMDLVLKSVPDGPVAKVNDTYIPKHEFVRFYQAEIQRLQRERGEAIPDGARVQLARMCVGTLIERALLFEQAQQAEIEVPQDQVEKAWAAQLEETRKLIRDVEGEEATEQDVLARIGYGSREEALERLETALITEKMRSQVIRESGLAVDDEAVREYYEANKAKFSRPATIHLRHIHIDPRKLPGKSMEEKKARATQLANQAIDRIYSGQRFESVAKAMSHSPQVDMGALPVNQIPPFMVQAATDLKPGECSDVLHSDYGAHIIQVVAVNEPRESDFETIAPMIRRELISGEATDVVHAYCDELIQNGADVRIFLELEKNLALAQTVEE